LRRFGSAALDLAYVASGRFDGFFEFGLKAWDVAAGALLVSEAGGAISCIDGTPLNLIRGDVMAANRLIEPTLRKETAAFLAEIGWKPRA
jgi:myo-inositol-1(or 4)-monophosphatase